MSAAPAIGTVTAGPLVVDEARAPAAVRDGSSAAKQAYSSAQGFEEMLTAQLSQSMLASSGLGEGGSESEAGSGAEGGASESSGALSSLLPQALTEGVMREGGLGLAGQLMRSLDPSSALPHGSTAAGAGTGGATVGTTAAETVGGAVAGVAGGTAAGAVGGTADGAVGSTGGVAS